MPVSFTGGDDDGVAGLETAAVATLHLNADPPLDDEATAGRNACASSFVECHAVDADRDAGLVMSETLDARLADEGRPIDRTGASLHRKMRIVMNP